MIQQILDLSQAPNPAFVIAYYGAEVEVGYWDGTEISYQKNRKLPEEDLIEIHIFDETTEFRAVRTEKKDGWQVLVLKDDCIIEQIKQAESEIENAYYCGQSDQIEFCKEDHILDEYMDFFGEEWISGEKGSTLLQDQKRKKTIYLTISSDQVKQGLSLGVRNYLIYDMDDKIAVYNYRLTGIFSGKSKEPGYSDRGSVRGICTGKGEMLKYE